MDLINQKVRIAGILEESIVDGPGIRTAIFMQGCKHNCLDCHNPETHNFNGGIEVSLQYIYNKITDNKLVTGVTFTGGDPIYQISKLHDLIIALYKNQYSIWLYTGFVFEDLVYWKEFNIGKYKTIIPKHILPLNYFDAIVDGPYVKELKDNKLKFRGSSNQRIIDTKKIHNFKLQDNETPSVEHIFQLEEYI